MLDEAVSLMREMWRGGLVTEDTVAQAVPCGADAERHRAQVQDYVDAGCDEVDVACGGPGYGRFFDLYRDEALPSLRS